MTLNIDIITLYPDLFPGPLKYSTIGKALKKQLWSLNVIDLHNFTPDAKTRVDDTPYGGGPGMVIRADVIGNALDHLLEMRPKNTQIIYMTPKGKTFKQKIAHELSQLNNIIILCGRFEGIDQRVIDVYSISEISIGDYILAGGESAAIVLVESCIRLLPGVLGNCLSTKEESFTDKNLLEYAHYTRPYKWKNLTAPDVLLSGNHRLIHEWRVDSSHSITKKNRPEFYEE